MTDATLETLPDLVALRISNGALKGEKLPGELKLLNWGRNDSTKGPVIVDGQSLESFAANQRALGFDRIALDFEHNTVPGTPEYERSQEPRKVAAYGTPEIRKDDGLWLTGIEWTPEGSAQARNYADLSPAVAQDEQGRVIFVHSTALARNGAVYDLSFFSAHKPTKPMSDQNKNLVSLVTLAAIAGLAATATEAEVLEAFKTREQKEKDLTDRLKKIEDAATKNIAVLSAKVDGKDLSFTAEDVVKLTAKVTSMEADIKATRDSATEAERLQLISRFAAEGKSPNGVDGKPMSVEALKAFPAETLRVLLANTPATVPLNARSRTTSDGKPAIDPALKGRARMTAAFNLTPLTTN